MIEPKLQEDDLVAIISPSNTVAHRKTEIEKARHNFERATGLKTVLAPNALKQHFYSAGTVKQLVDDFHWALKNSEVKAIIFSVGGNTAIELVDKLDYQLIKNKKELHQMLAQLRLWGALDKISGLIMGYCLDSDNSKILGNERDMRELVLEAT